MLRCGPECADDGLVLIRDPRACYDCLLWPPDVPPSSPASSAVGNPAQSSQGKSAGMDPNPMSYSTRKPAALSSPQVPALYQHQAGWSVSAASSVGEAGAIRVSSILPKTLPSGRESVLLKESRTHCTVRCSTSGADVQPHHSTV